MNCNSHDPLEQHLHNKIKNFQLQISSFSFAFLDFLRGKGEIIFWQALIVSYLILACEQIWVKRAKADILLLQCYAHSTVSLVVAAIWVLPYVFETGN